MSEPITGINGKIEIAGAAVLHCRKWSLSETTDNAEYASSSTGGYKKKAVGMRQWNFTADFYLDAAVLPTLVAGTTTGVSKFYTDGSTSKSFTGGIIDSIDNIETDVEGSGMISFTLTGSVWN